MSRDDPPEETENPICILLFDTQICVDENGAVSVYTGASNDESDDGFRVVATARSVIGDYFDSVKDVERRLREWADENRDQIDACVRHAEEIASLSARVRHLEVSLDAARAALKVGLPAGPMQRHQGNARDDGGQAMSEQWDGTLVMSTHGGPIIEMSLGEYLARKDAEIERLRTGLHRISLASQHSMSSREECGRIARETLEGKQ